MATAIGQLFDVYYKEFRPHSEYRSALEEARVAGMEEASNSIAGSLKKGLEYANAISGNSQLEQACRLQDGDSPSVNFAKLTVQEDLRKLSGVLLEVRDIPSAFLSVFDPRDPGDKTASSEYSIYGLPVFQGNVDTLLALGPLTTILHNTSDKLRGDIGLLAARMGGEQEELTNAARDAETVVLCMHSVSGPLREQAPLIEAAVDEYIAARGETSPTATLHGVYYGTPGNRLAQPDTMNAMLHEAQEAGNVLRQARPTDPVAQDVTARVDEIAGIFNTLTGNGNARYDGEPISDKLEKVTHQLQALRREINDEGNTKDSPQYQAEATIRNVANSLHAPFAGNYHLDRLVTAAAAEQAREKRMEVQVANALVGMGITGGGQEVATQEHPLTERLVQRVQPNSNHL